MITLNNFELRQKNMRTMFFIVVAALLTSEHATAQVSQPASGPEGVACFENLEAPEFPRSALQQTIDGSVWTWTQVSPQGTIDKIETQVVSAWGQGEKLLTPPVEKVIRAARIRPECAGKRVHVVFRYQIHGEPAPDPKVTSRTDAPNVIYIESRPAAAAKS